MSRVVLAPLSSEQLVIDATVGGKALTMAKYAGATKAIIQVSTAPIRITVDTATLTSSYGLYLDDTDIITLESIEEITDFRAIRATGVSSVLNIIYYG